MNGLHLNILSDAQKELWLKFNTLANMGFTLYGGTALALQLNHRRSLDFDFFSSKPLDSQRILTCLPAPDTLNIERDEERTLQLTTQSGVHISFFGHLSIYRVGTPIISEDNGIKIASLDDLMATKLKVLFNRIECKDYRDIAEMIRHGVSLSHGLICAKAIYGNTFQPMMALKAMTYFEGGDLADLSEIDKETLLDAAKSIESIGEIDVVLFNL